MHVFISYAKKDTRSLAIRLQETLQKLPHITAWMDNDLLPTSVWTEVISTNIQQCDLFIVLLSPDVNRPATDPNGISFVINEITFAQNLKKPILPVLAQFTWLPVQIASVQHIDLTRNFETKWSELIDYIAGLSQKSDAMPVTMVAEQIVVEQQSSFPSNANGLIAQLEADKLSRLQLLEEQIEPLYVFAQKVLEEFPASYKPTEINDDLVKHIQALVNNLDATHQNILALKRRLDDLQSESFTGTSSDTRQKALRLKIAEVDRAYPLLNRRLKESQDIINRSFQEERDQRRQLEQFEEFDKQLQSIESFTNEVMQNMQSLDPITLPKDEIDYWLQRLRKVSTLDLKSMRRDLTIWEKQVSLSQRSTELKQQFNSRLNTLEKIGRDSHLLEALRVLNERADEEKRYAQALAQVKEFSDKLDQLESIVNELDTKIGEIESPESTQGYLDKTGLDQLDDLTLSDLQKKLQNMKSRDKSIYDDILKIQSQYSPKSTSVQLFEQPIARVNKLTTQITYIADLVAEIRQNKINDVAEIQQVQGTLPDYSQPKGLLDEELIETYQ